jgi:hypothetical protein
VQAEVYSACEARVLDIRLQNGCDVVRGEAARLEVGIANVGCVPGGVLRDRNDLKLLT